MLWREGRLDFAGLQQRVHPADARARQLSPASPASFVVFDLLALDRRDVRPRPYRARRPCSRTPSGASSRTGWC